MPSLLRSAARPALVIAAVISAFFLPRPVFADDDAELAQAAKSPYDIARFVDTHKTFEWTPLWKALGITDNAARLMRSEEQGETCSEDLITVLDPPQVIVLLRGGVEHWQEVYLRSRRCAPPASVNSFRSRPQFPQ